MFDRVVFFFCFHEFSSRVDREIFCNIFDSRDAFIEMLSRGYLGENLSTIR